MNEGEIKTLIAKKTANPVGRPTGYNKQLAEDICTRIACGESLLHICQDKDMPGYATVMRWQIKHIKFRENYTQARKQQAETHAQALIDIALTEEDVNRARLLSDNIKWTASKLLPKVYGDRVDVQQEINVNFTNSLPRPNVINIDATSSVPKQIKGKTDSK